MWNVDDKQREHRERAERTLSEFKRLEQEYGRTREKIVERTTGGYRIRYVASKKKGKR